jgi:hypothetical protein
MSVARDEAFNALDRLLHCRNIFEAIAIQQEWMNSNMRRFGGAFDTLAGQATAMARDAASVAQESSEASPRASRARTGSAAAHAIRPDTRRAPARRPSPRRPAKTSRQQRKSRKRRAA